MTVYATNGAKLYIGGPFAEDTDSVIEADFASQTWVEIGEVEGLGSLGDSSAEITFDAIGSSRTTRVKGTRSAGTMELVCGLDSSDPGQEVLIAAEQTDFNYAFRIVLNDAPPSGTPSERMFVAMVASAVEAYDTANNVIKLNATLWVNSNVVKINAATVPLSGRVMAIVTVDELMAQAGLTSDAPADDLALLQQKGDAAQNHVERLLGFRIEDEFGGAEQDPVPDVLKEAVLQLACWWFENRESVESRDQMLPFGVSEIVTEYRDWTF